MTDNVPELAAIRRNRGISLEQIADSTKISIRSLEAIERGEFRKLPGGIYTTSYLRQYARAIDYDEDTLLACYHNQGTRAAEQKASSNKRDGVGGMRHAPVTGQ